WQKVAEVHLGKSVDLSSFLDHLSRRSVEVGRTDVMTRFILLFDDAGVDKAVVAPEALHQGSDVVGEKRIVIVEDSEEVRSQRIQACPPGGASVAVVGNDDAANPAEARPELLDDGIEPGHRVELNQK